MEQAAQLKSALHVSGALSLRPNIILVHNPSYREDRATHRRAHKYRHQHGYNRARYSKDRKYRRTCVVMRTTPDLDEDPLLMPPWEWVPC